MIVGGSLVVLESFFAYIRLFERIEIMVCVISDECRRLLDQRGRCFLLGAFCFFDYILNAEYKMLRSQGKIFIDPMSGCIKVIDE